MKRILAVLLISILTACASSPDGTTTTPAQQVFQIESGFNAALTIAVAYKNLPPCGQPTSPTLCSKPETVVKVQQVANSTQAALMAAQNTVRTPGAGANAQTAIVAARQALLALTSITATLAIK